MAAVILGPWFSPSCLLRPGRNKLNTLNLPKYNSSVGFVAACLEAFDHLPQVLFHPFLYKKDTMQVVGHHL